MLLAYCSYSFSETIFDTSPNAAATGLEWVMTNVLPQETGLTVNNVFYTYTTVKNEEDAMLVHVQNENVFRETDDWTGLPGNTINKIIRLGEIPLERFSTGSIEVEGTGEVVNPSVVYSYKYTPEEDSIDLTQFVPEYEDPYEDELIQEQIELKVELEEEEEQLPEESEEKEERLEKMLGIANTTALAAAAEAKASELFAMATLPQVYFTSIPSGVYNDTLQYKTTQMPKNKSGRRLGLAQQVLHQRLVDSQYSTEGENQ